MKRNYLMASLLAIAAAFSGCSEVDEFFDTNPSKTYEATVVASKEKIDGLDTADEGTRAVFYGGNTARYVTLWDKGDVVHVYKQNGTEVGTLLVTDDVNKDAQFKLKAVLSGSLTGSFTEGESLNLYLPSKARDYNPEQHQTGYINDLSSRFSYQKTTVQIDKIEGSKITLKEADMSHLQAYLRFVLTDMEGNRLHPQQLVISADPIEGYTGRIVTSVDENGTEQYGDLIIENAEKDLGEYPAEMFVALLNGTNNTEKVNYHLTVVDADGVVYSGPSTTQVNTTDDRPFQGTPPTGKLTRVWRKLAKVEPTVELGTQMKMVVGTKRTRVPVVKAGETVVPATCTYTSSNYAVASVNASTGEVMALSTGTATITVNIAPYGVSRTYTVTVTESPVEYVDLGLSVNWATMNVGAESETDYGTYFAWGEVQGYTSQIDFEKNEYSWDTYKWGTEENLTKYNTTDSKTVLDAEDDAVIQNWGGNWRMPTKEEIEELVENTDVEWTAINNVYGRKFMKKTDHSIYIFLPAAGVFATQGVQDQGVHSLYWASLRQTEHPNWAWVLYGSNSWVNIGTQYGRYPGRPVRAVCPKTNITIASQMKVLQGTTKTRKPVVTLGSTDVTSQCTFSYSSSNYGVARVSPTGEVTGVTPGTATITITSSAPYAATKTYTVTVTEPIAETTANYVDLGLPSGTKWAKMNVGATSETEDGTYFAWGEVDGYTDANDFAKNNYSWETYKWCNGSVPEVSLTKYVLQTQASAYGHNGFYDNKTKLTSDDDAVIQNWGGNWRMPTKEECQELVDNTDNEWTSIGGVSGRKFMKKSDHSVYIFFPTAGALSGTSLSNNPERSLYWSSTLGEVEEVGTQRAYVLYGSGSWVSVSDGYDRFPGRPIRAIIPSSGQ